MPDHAEPKTGQTNETNESNVGTSSTPPAGQRQPSLTHTAGYIHALLTGGADVTAAYETIYTVEQRQLMLQQGLRVFAQCAADVQGVSLEQFLDEQVRGAIAADKAHAAAHAAAHAFANRLIEHLERHGFEVERVVIALAG